MRNKLPEPLKDPIFLFLCVVCILVLSYTMYHLLSVRPACKALNLDVCSEGAINCYKDCKSFGFEYFKYNKAPIGIDECWCKDKGIPRRIY